MSSRGPSLFGEQRKVLTVTEITRRIKDVLTGAFRELWISGEVSNVTYHRSGHVYFTMKDEGAALSCVMWRSAAARLRFRIEEGSQLVVLGDIGVYEVRGNYQLVVSHAEPAGIGALALAFEQLKKKLAAEGLFDEERKRPLPFLPRRIGIVTSPTGAAVRDMLRTILGRFPRARIVIHPARVQGEGAAAEIAQAVRTLNEMNEVQVIIVGRGGGSLEDLWPFNEEAVARAIFASAIPVISAVGHEIDVTISDFVADARAATPTAAGEMVVPSEEELRIALMQMRQRLALALRNSVQQRRVHLDRLGTSYALRRPLELVQRRSQQLDELWRRVGREARLFLDVNRRNLDSAKSRAESLNPRSVLARGYSITTLAGSDTPLSGISGLEPGLSIETALASGTIISRVERTEEKQ
jgi:exodeoxyribonuclease VII large subunit